MIGLDTNILVRLFARDDARQFAAAARFVDEAPRRSLVVGLIVVVELVWTLQRAYDFERAAIEIALQRLTEHPSLLLPELDFIREAVHRSREAGADIADSLIALANRQTGCSTTMTFDGKAARSDMFTLLPS